MKHLSLLLLFLFSARLAAHAQQARFEGTVLDAKSRQPLPFASVYVGPGVSTITNAEGAFALLCDSADVMRISYVGYKTVHVRASQLGSGVALQPQETLLSEVTVMPIGPLIDKIAKETLRAMRKHKKERRLFFYRQTAFVDSTCYEFAESFLAGCPVVTLREPRLLSGRYAGAKPDSANTYFFFGNFYTFSQVDVVATYKKPSPLDDVVPLFRNCERYYDISYEVTADGDDRLFVIHFVPKPEALLKNVVLDATLYVDEKTLHIRRIEGKTRFWVALRRRINSFRYDRRTVPTWTSYDVHLSDGQGYPEVQSVFVQDVHRMGKKVCTTRSILFNVGEPERLPKKGETLDFGSELHKAIERRGYDADFWDKNEIVRRTPVEQQVLEMFERQRLFGVMEPSAE